MSSLFVCSLTLLILASSWAPIHFVIEVVVVVVNDDDVVGICSSFQAR